MSEPRTHENLGSAAIAKGGARLLSSRRLMRAPIALYKARLGFLFGSRMLMLEHVGRKSGAKRYVVLEVFGHPGHDTYVVVSGFGDRAQWFRNVKADPRVRISTARHASVPAVARLLSQQEADAALAGYVAKHPRAWNRFKSVIETTLETSISDHNTALPMVELTVAS